MDSIFQEQIRMSKELQSRLRRIEGQVKGVIKMIEEQRSCGDVVIQLGAIKAAVNRVGFMVLACHLAQSIEEDKEAGRELEKTMQDFMDVLKKFS